MFTRRGFVTASAATGLMTVFPMITLGQGTKRKHGALTSLHAFCRAVPKAELHVHFNSVIYPDVALAFAKKNGLGRLSFSSAEEFYRHPNCDPAPCRIRSEQRWAEFFSTIDELMSTLRTADDVRDAVMHWIKRSGVPSNLKYAELTVPHPRFHRMSISLDDYFGGLLGAHELAKEEHDIELNFIGSTFLYESVPDGVEAVKDFAKYKDQLPIVGITGLNEGAKDVTVKAPVYDLAQAHGFKKPMHVGLAEPFGLKRMWDALKKIEIDRIDHGYMAVLDENLMDFIVEQQIPMTSCPHEVAGGHTKFVKDDPYISWDWDNFPFKTFYEKGILVSVNSDTPAIGNYTLADVYIALVDHYDFTQKDVLAWARNSFNSAFLSKFDKNAYLDQLEGWARSNNSEN